MKRLPRKAKKKVPHGPYCYTGVRFDISTGIYHIRSCPFYRGGEGLFGKCTQTKGEIMDQVKECGINTDF